MSLYPDFHLGFERLILILPQGLVQQYCPGPTISRTAIERIYARGMVSHSGGEHRVLRLGELLHEVYRKAEGRSWSAEGSFD